MKPRIGISANFRTGPERTGGELWLNANYATAIAEAGGVPILIPHQADVLELVDTLDGILIPGGPDIDPREYGQEPHPATGDLVPGERYGLESRLFDAIPREMPYLGICYGCQFLNVRSGGDLEQHVVDRVGNEDDVHGNLQQYQVNRGSKLAGIIGEGGEGQSWHHQAVGRVADGLQVVARNQDGTVEAIEDPNLPFRIGVQWHPERTPNSETTKRLMGAFIEAAVQYRRSKS